MASISPGELVEAADHVLDPESYDDVDGHRDLIREIYGVYSEDGSKGDVVEWFLSNAEYDSAMEPLGEMMMLDRDDLLDTRVDEGLDYVYSCVEKIDEKLD